MPIEYARKIINYVMVKLKTSGDEILTRLIKEHNLKNYVEVGIWKGNLLFNMAKRNPHIKIWGVDGYKPENYEGYSHWEVMSHTDQEGYDKVKNMVINKASDFENVSIIPENSVPASKRFEDGSLDMVFIDALHDYKGVSEDIKTWLPKVRSGGILCGHDFKLSHFGLIKAVDDVIGCDNVQIHRGTSIWIHRKK